MKKRILSMVIAVVMILGLIPAAALTSFATEATTATVTMMFRTVNPEGAVIDDTLSLSLMNIGFDNGSPSTWSNFPLGDTVISFANALIFPSGYQRPDDLTLTVTDSNSDGIGEVTTTTDYASVALEEIDGKSVYVITLMLEEAPKAEITSISITGDCYDPEKKILTVSAGDTFTVTLTGTDFAHLSEEHTFGYLPLVMDFVLPNYSWEIEGNVATKTYTVQEYWLESLTHPHNIVYSNQYSVADSEVQTGIYIVCKDDTKVQSKLHLKPVDGTGTPIEDVRLIPWSQLNEEYLDTEETNFRSFFIGENKVRFLPEDVEGDYWIPAIDEFTVVADENGVLTVSGDERLTIEEVDGVYYLTIPFEADPTKVVLPMYLKPVDSEGNPLDVSVSAYARDTSGANFWIGVESMDSLPLIFTVGAGVIYEWQYLPDGYSKPNGIITVDVDAEGNVTVTGGNATVEKTEDATYLVFTLYEEGETVPPRDEEPIRISGASLALGVDLTMNYTAEITDEELLASLDRISMRFTMNGKTTVVALDEDLVDSDGHYVFPFESIAPQQMTDNIKAELLVDDEVVAVKDYYSVLFYLWSIEELTYPDLIHPLVHRLIDYGYFAQKYTGYSPETLEFLYPLQYVEYEYQTPTATDKKLVTAEGVTLGGVQFKSATVWFDTVNRIGVTLNAITADTKLVVKINDDEIGTTYENLTSTIFYTEGISAVDFADVYTFELYEGDTLLQTLTYSVNSYVYSMMEKAQEDGDEPSDMAMLAIALYNYGLTAELYRGDSINVNRSEITDKNAEAYSYNGETATYDAETGWTPVLDPNGVYTFFTVDLKAGDQVEFLLSEETPVMLLNVNNNENSLISNSIASCGTFTVEVDGTYSFITMVNVNAKVWIMPCVGVDTLDELIDAMANGGDIKLTGDIDMGETLIEIDGVDVTLDLNGYNITASTAYSLDIYDATLTVKGNGSITSTGGEAIYLNSDTSGLIVEGGTITGFPCAVFVGDGEAMLNGGTFIGEDSGAVNSGDAGSIVITGGSYNTDPSAYLADGYSATLDEDTGYYVVAESNIILPTDAIELTDENVIAYTNGTDTAIYSATDGWIAVAGVEFGEPIYFTVSLEAGDAVYFKLSGEATRVGLNGDGIAALALENVSQGVLQVITTGEYEFYTFSEGLTVKVYVVKGGAIADDSNLTEISWGGPLEDAANLLPSVALTAGTIAPASVTIGTEGWVAYYNEISSVTIGEGLRAYVVVYQDGSRVRLDEITDGIIPVNTPVLLKGEAGTYELNATATEGAVETNLLTVSENTLTRDDMDMNYIYCVFSVWEGELTAFVSTIDIPAYQPYFIAENYL